MAKLSIHIFSLLNVVCVEMLPLIVGSISAHLLMRCIIMFWKSDPLPCWCGVVSGCNKICPTTTFKTSFQCSGEKYTVKFHGSRDALAYIWLLGCFFITLCNFGHLIPISQGVSRFTNFFLKSITVPSHAEAYLLLAYGDKQNRRYSAVLTVWVFFSQKEEQKICAFFIFAQPFAEFFPLSLRKSKNYTVWHFENCCYIVITLKRGL